MIQKMGGDVDYAVSVLCYNLWYIWVGRNKFIFEGMPVDPRKTIEMALDSVASFLSINQNNHHIPIPSGSVSQQDKWNPPPENCIKINVDAATDLNFLLGAVSVVVRDHYGALLTGFTRRFPCSSSEEAEAEGVMYGLLMAEALGVDRVIVESDNQEVCQACLSRGDPPWRIAARIHKIKASLAQHPNFSVSWIRRSANKVADLVAKLALKNNLPLTWSWFPPTIVRAAILADIFVCRSSSSIATG